MKNNTLLRKISKKQPRRETHITRIMCRIANAKTLEEQTKIANEQSYLKELRVPELSLVAMPNQVRCHRATRQWKRYMAKELKELLN